VRLLVVGGKLQGTEACYLAAKAGYETVLVDRRPEPPAAGLADRHVVADVTAGGAAVEALIGSCDAVLPACEDERTLAWLAHRVPQLGVPLLFDLAAYRTTASKLASSRLFDELDVPRPRPWPACGFPAVVKPDVASGSEGVRLAGDEQELQAARDALQSAGHAVVVEEYVPGPSLSIEVIGWAGEYVPLQVTGLEFDAGYDCKRVVAPVGEAGVTATVCRDGSCDWSAAVAPGATAALEQSALRIAAALGLQGVMDVEVMVRGAEPLVLEIDARLPSQTPTAVYWSSGLNIVELLAESARRGLPPRGRGTPRRACVYQHVRAGGGMLSVSGEHVMAMARPLVLVPGFYGADEALTDAADDASDWSATLICSGADVQEARARAHDVVQELARARRLTVVDG
jgi:pyrrolysine biosynthesis protein PylC